MRLLHLSISHFGIFEGSHTFDLMPRLDEGRRRHLTVFSGHNGTGKSTLFQAMALALYGSLALGDRVSEQEYTKFILSRFHKRPQQDEDLPVATSEAGVGLSFQYVQSGQPMVVNLERRWRRRGSSVQETLELLQNCKAPDVEPPRLPEAG
jgi:DNA sulfur modification protein DndD